MYQSLGQVVHHKWASTRSALLSGRCSQRDSATHAMARRGAGPLLLLAGYVAAGTPVSAFVSSHTGSLRRGAIYAAPSPLLRLVLQEVQGTYFCNISVGTPPQSLAVLVSRRLASQGASSIPSPAPGSAQADWQAHPMRYRLRTRAPQVDTYSADFWLPSNSSILPSYHAQHETFSPPLSTSWASSGWNDLLPVRAIRASARAASD
jgi:hypothetical protein